MALSAVRGALAEIDRALSALSYHDTGHGYDAFGLHPTWVGNAARVVSPLYDLWFRVRSYGIENVPTEGSAIIASNHSGTLPFDGAMIYLDVLRRLPVPRVVRPLADYFVPELPFVSVLFSRLGVVAGSRGNMHRLLDDGELLLVFPEGVPGIGKPFSRRYELAPWRVGHAELAIKHQVPVIPVAVIGAEEQMPQIAQLPIRAFGSPYLPIPLTLFPLPVRYHIHYGEPICFADRYPPEAADDPESVDGAAREVRDAVERLISSGLALREGVFA